MVTTAVALVADTTYTYTATTTIVSTVNAYGVYWGSMADIDRDDMSAALASAAEASAPATAGHSVYTVAVVNEELELGDECETADGLNGNWCTKDGVDVCHEILCGAYEPDYATCGCVGWEPSAAGFFATANLAFTCMA